MSALYIHGCRVLGNMDASMLSYTCIKALARTHGPPRVESSLCTLPTLYLLSCTISFHESIDP